MPNRDSTKGRERETDCRRPFTTIPGGASFSEAVCSVASAASMNRERTDLFGERPSLTFQDRIKTAQEPKQRCPCSRWSGNWAPRHLPVLPNDPPIVQDAVAPFLLQAQPQLLAT